MSAKDKKEEKDIALQLAAFVSPQQIISGAELCAACQIDGKAPAVVVRPRNAMQVASVLGTCARHGWGIIPWGSGTQIHIGNVPRMYHVGLDLGGLDQVIEYDVENLTLTAGAGCSLQIVHKLVSEHGQFLPLNPPLGEQATLGGTIASDAFGPCRLRYGGARDIVLGLQVAVASGELIEIGGKTVKNVAGYDLTKLFVGSFGSLGVITRATCRLWPKPAQERTLALGFDRLEAVSAFVKRVLYSKSLPASLDVAHDESLKGLYPFPLYAVVGINGSAEAIKRQTSDFQLWAREEGALSFEVIDVSSDGIGRLARDLPVSSRAPLILRVVVPIAAVSTCCGALSHLEAERQAIVGWVARWGIGVVYVMIDAPLHAMTAIVQTVRALVQQWQGHAIVERMPTEIKRDLDVWGPTRDDFPLMRALKSRFDPQGILSPGRFIGGL